MNDELVTAYAEVVSELLVIAPYSARGFTKPPPGVLTGEKPRQLSPAARTVAGNSRASGAHESRMLPPPGQVAKRAFTSAFFVASGAKRVRAFRAGILRSTANS